MLKQIKQTSAPSLFTTGMLKYKQGEFEEARNLFLMAAKNMPDLKNDNFFKVAFLLVESELEKIYDTVLFEEALDSLEDSPYKETNDFLIVINALKRKLNNHNSH